MAHASKSLGRPQRVVKRPRVRTPEAKRAATEDEALNAVGEARKGEPRYPLARLLRKSGHGLDSYG